MTSPQGSSGTARTRTVPEGRAPRVRFDGLTKQYPNGVRACVDVSIDVAPGSVHAIVGENGAGKSTLMKMLYGMEHPTASSLRFDDETVELRTREDAIARGVGMVHQSFMLVPTFTIAQNVVLGAEPTRFGLVDRRAMIRDVDSLAEEFQLPVRSSAKARDVSVGVLQRVEILKALYRGARVLVLDEPTAVLTPQETAELFRALRRFAASGRTVIFISHKLREVLAVADRITVMRAGRVVGETTPSETSERALATMMVGRDIVDTVLRPSPHIGEDLLDVSGLSCLSDLRQEACKDVSLIVRAGEIVCCVGVEGNGQTELVEAIAGLRPATAGTAPLAGVELLGKSVGQRRGLGLSHIPEDRMKDGAALEESIEDNLIVDRFASPHYRRGPFQRTRRIREDGESGIHQFQIRAADTRVPVGALSGGNIQKVVIARELTDRARVILAAQPTRGVDVGAMQFIYDEIRRARDAGAGVFIVSADLTEALSLADRLVVMRNGRIGRVLLETTTLTIIALSAAIPFRAGLMSLGAEGQIYTGALAATVVSLYVPLPPGLAIIVPVLAAMTTGALAALIPGWMKAQLGANELVSTLMLNAVLVRVYAFVLTNWLTPDCATSVASDYLPDDAIIPSFTQLLGTSFDQVNLMLLAVPVLAVGAWLLMKRTPFGYEVRMSGSNATFARYGGIRSKRVIIMVFLVSGAIAGIAGAHIVQGVNGRALLTLSAGAAFDGILIAILARNNPLVIPVAAFLHAYLKVGGDVMEQELSIGTEIVDVIQALIVLMVTSQFVLTLVRRA